MVKVNVSSANIAFLLTYSTAPSPVLFKFDWPFAIEILTHHEDSPSWKKNVSLYKSLFEVCVKICNSFINCCPCNWSV